MYPSQETKKTEPNSQYIQNSKPNNWPAIIIGVLIIALTGYGFYYIFKTPPKPEKKDLSKSIVPVVAGIAKELTIPTSIYNIGNVEAYTVVNVDAQVGGILTKVNFKQGDYVKRGQLIFEIDSRSYKASLDQALANINKDKSNIKASQSGLSKDLASLDQAKANRDKDKAQLAYDETEVKRYLELSKEGAVSYEQYDQMKTNLDSIKATLESDNAAIANATAVIDTDKAAIEQAKATLESDQALAETARIQLGYTKIYSPIEGRTGALNVYEGNVVKANDTTPLVVIYQVKPIYVSFSIPEEYLQKVMAASKMGTLTVEVLINGDVKEKLSGGIVSFIDNSVDKTTGTIRLRATFPNQNLDLWPGEFVRVIATLPEKSLSIVVPTRAVVPSQQGSTVFLIKDNNTVEPITVKVNRTYHEYSVIDSSIKSGDKIVLDGQVMLRPGSKITIKEMDK